MLNWYIIMYTSNRYSRILTIVSIISGCSSSGYVKSQKWKGRLWKHVWEDFEAPNGGVCTFLWVVCDQTS